MAGTHCKSKTVAPRACLRADDPCTSHAPAGHEAFWTDALQLQQVDLPHRHHLCPLCHSTVDDRPASDTAWTAGQTATSTWAPIVSLVPDAGLQKIADLLHSANPGGPAPTVADVKTALGARHPT